jgi:type VI secretion system protein ImpJ
VRELCGLLHQRGEALAARLSQPGRGGVAEIADFLLLEAVNRSEPLFVHLQQRSVLHPQTLYAACLSLAGDLATFRERRRPPPVPEYQHDDPSRCFRPVIDDLRQSLSMVMEQTAIPIELQDRKYGIRVAIIADTELQRNASFVLAVAAQLPGEALRARFPTQVKIGPVERIRDLVNLQLPGVTLRPLPVAPRQIPYHAASTISSSTHATTRCGNNWSRQGDLRCTSPASSQDWSWSSGPSAAEPARRRRARNPPIGP